MALPQLSSSILLHSCKLNVALPKILILIMVALQPAESLSFDFTSFTSFSSGITLQGDAVISDGAMNLTKIYYDHKSSIGRATYPDPLQIWDSKTGKLNDITTIFKFSVRRAISEPQGDGLAFFMAPVGSKIAPNSGGGFLGLFNSTDTSLEKIVAVEFDSFSNNFDPAIAHVGFDLNSIVQATYDPWQTTSEGTTQSAVLSYDSRTMNLKLQVSEPGNSYLSSTVDLRKFLPEFVEIGFSASTGFGTESHDILSWAFISSF